MDRSRCVVLCLFALVRETQQEKAAEWRFLARSKIHEEREDQVSTAPNAWMSDSSVGSLSYPIVVRLNLILPRCSRQGCAVMPSTGPAMISGKKRHNSPDL